MAKETWSEKVKSRLASLDMTYEQLGVATGYSTIVIRNVVNGRYANSTYMDVVNAVNRLLNITGVPERSEKLPSDDWCVEVKVALVKRNMKVKDLASAVKETVDKTSSIVNGKKYEPNAVKKINKLLDIKIPARAVE